MSGGGQYSLVNNVRGGGGQYSLVNNVRGGQYSLVNNVRGDIIHSDTGIPYVNRSPIPLVNRGMGAIATLNNTRLVLPHNQMNPMNIATY